MCGQILLTEICVSLNLVKNYACRIISGAKNYDHISPLLNELNWLPVEK